MTGHIWRRRARRAGEKEEKRGRIEASRALFAHEGVMMGTAGKKSTQKLYTLEGTPQSSTTQLTDPPLYSIFGGRNNIYTENQDIELSAGPSEKEIKMLAKSVSGRTRTKTRSAGDKRAEVVSGSGNGPLLTSVVMFALNLCKISVFGIAICLLFGSVHDSNPDTIPDFNYNVYRWHGKGDRSLPVIVLNSCVLDAFICLILFGIKRHALQREVSSTGGSGSGDRIETVAGSGRNTSILQLSVALLGIAYCFKKLTWSSTLQADLTLMLLNVFFSRYLGCTLEEVTTAAAVFAAAYGYDYVTFHPPFELSLWKASFMFFTTIIFIKLRKSNTLF